MNPYLVYKLYLALRLHFTSDKYDIIAMRGRVRATEQAFERRTDLFGIKRLARKYNVTEATNFMVANFVIGDINGGMFTIGSEKVYTAWLTKMESLSYLYQEELRTLCEDVSSFDGLFSCRLGHPPILKAYLGGSASIETLVILNRVLPFADRLSTYMSEDVIWTDVAKLIRKYTPFVRIDKDKYTVMTHKVIRNNFPEETK